MLSLWHGGNFFVKSPPPTKSGVSTYSFPGAVAIVTVFTEDLARRTALLTAAVAKVLRNEPNQYIACVETLSLWPGGIQELTNETSPYIAHVQKLSLRGGGLRVDQ